MAARDRKKMKEALLKRQQESHDRRKDSGKFKSFFRDDLEKVNFWKCSDKEHTIDIIPYIAGGNDPHNAKGDLCYVLDLFIHGGVGVNEDAYICLARSFNKPCPICDHQKKLKEEGADEDSIIKINPTRRTVYNIVCYDDDKELEKGIQIWTVAHRYMEKLLTPLGKKRGGGRILFVDPDEGKSISFERSGMGMMNTDYIGHKFEDRDYTISDKLLDAAHCLDDLIHIPTTEEVYLAYWGEKGEEEAEEESVEEAEEEVDEKEVEQDEVEEKEEEVEKVKVKKKEPAKDSIAAKRERRKIEKGKKESTGPKCPGGGEFGVDLDKLGENCDNCPIWDDCAKRSDELEEEDLK